MDTLFEQIALSNIEQARKDKAMGVLPTHHGARGPAGPEPDDEAPPPAAQLSEAEDVEDGVVTFSSGLVRGARREL